MSQSENHEIHLSSILNRIIRENNLDNLIPKLEKLSGSDLKSLLLHVFNTRTKDMSVREIFTSYQENYPFLGVSELDQRDITKFKNLFFESVSKEFSAVELSPVNPIGLNGTLASISQNNLCSTNHGYEVIGDPTTPLALETAIRRKNLLSINPKDTSEVHLCTSQRILRLQPFDPKKGYMQHFSCFGLSSGGRDNDWEAFIIRNLTQHIKSHLGFIQRLNNDQFSIKDVVVSFSHMGILESIIKKIGADRKTIKRNTGNPEYHLFREHGITLPSLVDVLESIPDEESEKLGISKYINLVSRIATQVIYNLRTTFPEIRFCFNIERIAGIGYYTGFCFHIHGTTQQGLTLQLSDGGFTNWLKKLLSSKKEFLLISGIGEDLVHKMFKNTLFSHE